jgi:sec-independent protein translocase protein TatA
MIIGGSNLIIIVLLGLVLIFGTKKLPQVSRTLGRAMGEYGKARDMIRNEIQSAGSLGPQYGIPRITGPVSSEREKLDAIAKSLGMNPAGLTDDQLKAMISQRMQQSSGSSV